MTSCTLNGRYLNREADITNQDMNFLYSNQNLLATTTTEIESVKFLILIDVLDKIIWYTPCE